MSTNDINHPTVIRTERGLTISGTRITLYQIMACLEAELAPEFIRDHFKLSIKQTSNVLTYISQNKAEIETEYQQVLAQAEQNRHYWEKRNREQLRQAEEYIATTPPRTGQDQAWHKLKTWKNRLQLSY